MKKYLLLIYLLALSCTVSVYADPVDSIVAKTIAKNFYNRSCPAAIEWLTLAHVKKNRDGAAVYYIFNINQDDGFVMVSADDAAFPVLGYSPTGHFAHNEVSPQFAYWVQGYEDQISYLKTNHVKANSKVKNEWQKYLEVRSITTFGVGDNQNPGGVGPLLTTEWNQSPNYNDLCPSGSVTGCVATAMAQIMRYWKYPQKGTGTVPAYTSAKNHYSLPATNLANTTYQWADMPDKLTNGSSSAEKKAVATLMYHCGIAVEMDYGFSSGAYVIALDKAVCAENAYKKYFGYDASTIKGWRRSEYPGDWVALLKIELNNGRPIQYVGYDETKGGHTWICDGFDKNDFFHMNWGWGGYQDAYYNLDALDPSNGANDNFTFNSNKQAVVGIKPTCYSAELIITNPACSNSNPSAGSQVTVSCYENNNGNANAGVHKVNVYLSKSATLSSSAATLLKQLSVASVTSQGQSSLLTSTVTVPAGISGQYYLFFVADAEEAIAECNEENNAKPISISITASNSCSTPPNDGCSGSSNATALRFDTGGACENPVSSSSCGATKSGFPDCGGTNDDDDVFFTFVPTTANAVIRVAPSSGYDAVFQLLSGLCGANMQAISPGCVNSKGIGEVETFQYNNLIPGNTYFIRVWHAGSGWGTGNFSICVYGNSCIVPSAPASLSPGSNTAPGVSVTTTTPQLSWSAASGATTYKVRIMADPYTLNGIVYASDCVTSPFTVPAGILKNGISYKWDVTALSDCNASCNNTSAGVYFSVNSSSCLAPTIQAMDISIESISPTQMTVRWSSGNGTRCIVKINSTNNFTNPINGTSPAANATYSSSGEQIVYDGNSSSTIIYGLKPGTSYCIKVFEANCSGTSSVYNTANGNNNPNCQITTTATCSAPSIPAGIISFSDVTINSMVVFWGRGNGSRCIVKMNTTSSFTDPVNGTDPSANSNYSSGQQVVYNGTGGTATITGLIPGTDYWFRVYEYNCSGSSTVYNIITAISNPNHQITLNCSVPTVQAEEINFKNVNLNSITVGWKNGNGTRRIVKINTVNSFIAPVNGSDPVANSNYSGSGEQIIYNGTGNNVTVAGLTAGKGYYFRVYEANCSSGSSVYLITSANNNPHFQTSCTIVSPACIPGIITSYNNYDIGPQKIVLSDLTFTSGGYTEDGFKAYLDQSCVSQANVIAGNTYTLSVTTGSFNPEKVRVWIDYNNDGNFSGNELILNHNGQATAEVHSVQFIIPETAVSCTKLRMRVMSDFNRSPDPQPCNNLQYGQTEDYSVYIRKMPRNIITITTGGNPACTGQNITFTATPVNEGTAPVFQWEKNNISVGTNSLVYSTNTLTNNDVISCKLLNVNISCPAGPIGISNFITMVVNAMPITPVVSINASPDVVVCGGIAINFTAVSNASPGIANGYQWLKNNVNTGTNSLNYSSAVLVSGDVITCKLNSNACVTLPTVISNAITMSVGAIACVPHTVKDTNSYDIGPSKVVLNDLTVSSKGFTGDGFAGYIDQTCTQQATLATGKTYSLSVTTGLWNPENVRAWIDYNNDGIFQSTELVMSHNGTSNNETHTVQFTIPDAVVSCTKLRLRIMSDWNASPTPQPCTDLQYGQTEDYSVYISRTPKNTILITSGSNPGCAGQTITFKATPVDGGSAPAYQWKKNGINVGTNSELYSSTTLVNGDVISCVLTSNASCIATAIATSNAITITTISLPTVVITNPSAVCTPSTIDLTSSLITSSGSTASLSYTYWNNALATSALTNANAVTSTGVYYIKGMMPATGCASIQPVTATINPLPTVVITNPSVCVPLTIDLRSSSIISGSTAGLSYTYWNNAPATSALANANSITATGVYYIKGTIPTTGCAIIQPVTATVNPLPTVIVTNPAAICAPLTVDLTSATITTGSTVGLSYTQWRDALAISPLANANTITTSGVYYIKGTIPVTGCGVVKPVTVTINPLPTVASITGALSVCVNFTTTLSDLTTGGLWTSSDITKATVSSIGVVTGVAAGTATITYSVVNANGCTTTVASPITVNPIPAKPAIILSATDLASSSATGNQWYNDAGVINGATGQTYRPVLSGYYKVQVTNSGCSSLFSDPYYYLVTAITNISAINGGSYQILPNPVMDLLIIKARNQTNRITAQVIDVNGKVVLIKNFSGNITISMKHLSAGTYSILLTDLKTKMQESKIILKQ